MSSRFFTLTSLFYFFYFWATAVFVIFVPKTLLALDYTPIEIGVILSVMPLIRFATPFIFGSKLKLTRKTFIYSLFLSTLFFATFILTYHNFWLLFLNTLIYGIFITITLPFVDSMALREIPKESYGKSRLFGSIGFMLAAIILGAGELASLEVYLHYLISVALMAVFGSFIVGTKEDVEKQSSETAADDAKNYRDDIFFWLALLLSQLSFGAFYGFFTIFETEHGISVEAVTYLWSIGVLAEIVMFATQGKILNLLKPLFIIKIALFSLAARWLLIHFFEGHFWLAAFAQLSHALNFALFTTAAFLYINQRYKDKKKAQMHFYGFSYGLGGFFGSLVSGALYGPNIFFYSALFATLSLVAILLHKGEDAALR